MPLDIADTSNPNKPGVQTSEFRLTVASMLNVLSAVTRMHNEYFANANIRVLAASFCFYIPIYRDFLVGTD